MNLGQETGDSKVAPDPAQLVRDAWEAGAAFDLTGVGFGRFTWGNKTDISTEPESYYRFLAGLAYLTRVKTALEIGTHWGGSAVAIVKGMERHCPDARLVTIDIRTESDNFLPTRPESRMIMKLVGDANWPETVLQVRAALDSVDLLYLDADHTFLPTLHNFAVYAALFPPRFVVMDDIFLNDDMKMIWELVRKAYPGRCINCNDAVPGIRREDYGFGLVVMP